MTETTDYVRPAIQNVSDEELLEDVRLVKSTISYYQFWGEEDNLRRENERLQEKIRVLENDILKNNRVHKAAERVIKDSQRQLWNIEIEQARRSDEKARASIHKSHDAKKTKTREERIDEKYALLPEAFKNSMAVVDVRKFIEDNML